MNSEMIKTITDRVNEMRQNPKIQSIMMKFEKKEDAEIWLIKSAIATLFGVHQVSP